MPEEASTRGGTEVSPPVVSRPPPHPAAAQVSWAPHKRLAQMDWVIQPGCTTCMVSVTARGMLWVCFVGVTCNPCI